MLSREGAKFDVMELDERKDGDAIQAALFKMTGRRTVPNGEHRRSSAEMMSWKTAG